MPVAKIAVSIDEKMVRKLDALVNRGLFKSRSGAIQAALDGQFGKLDRSRLAIECGKLDAEQERIIAEEGLEYEVEQWPEY